MLKNYPSSIIFTPYRTAKNLNNYLPNKTCIKLKKNYKFNDLNPVHSEKKFNVFNKTRNYKTPNRQPKSKISNSCVNLNSFNAPNSNKNPKKTENFFNKQINPNKNYNLLNSARYISSPLLNQQENNMINSNKKTLILDLDETLVHSAFFPFQRKSDIILNIKLERKNHIIHVLKRPNLDYFLKKISELFNVIIFTASIKEYAEPLIDKLDPDKKFGRLFRQNCLNKNGLYIKDLKQIGNNYKDMIIIDNNPISFSLNRDNGLPIITWYENSDDNELIKLIPLLEYLSKVDDVRPIINQIMNIEKNKIDFSIVKKLLLKTGYISDDKNMINESSYNLYKQENGVNQNENKEIYNNENIDFNNDLNNNNYLYNGKDKIFNIPYRDNSTLYSFSNMSYDEIQNEGYIEENSNNMNIFNNYNNNIVKNKNRNNLFLKTKEIFNISTSNQKRLIQYDNNINKLYSRQYNIIAKTQDEKNKNDEINNYEFNYEKANEIINKYEIYKDNITFNYSKQNKLNDNSFDEIRDKVYIRNKQNNLNDITGYRNHSMINKKNPKNYDIFNNNINIFNKKQLYNKPINIKKGNISRDKYNTEQILENNEENKYKTNIELRRERLEEMKQKIEEINKDIKDTEKYFHQTKNEISKNQDEYNLYNNDINYKSAKIISNKKSIYYNDENINNMNSSNDDIKTYKIQIIDTDINRKEKNYDYNSGNKKNNLFNSKINNSNVNIYRNHNNKISNIFEQKSDNSKLNNKYSQRIEKKYIHQTQNLNKLKNRNIFKNFKNTFINKSNGKIDKTDTYNKFKNDY